jgi:zinc protease
MSKAILTSATVLAALSLSAWLPADQPLPTDRRLKTGQLANGVKWIYRQHGNPEGKMALLLHVRTGSLNEVEEERGLAHFLEHMAFNGSEHFPPGTLVPYFESIGMEFGNDLNAFTSFDQTVYMLFLPDTTVPQVEKALTVLSDYAFRLSLAPPEIEKERGVILSERRDRMGLQERLRDQLFEKLFPGSRLAERLPIGLEAVISGAPRPVIERYYHTWYRPDRMTLLLVGDAPADAYVPLVEKSFGQAKASGEAKPAAHADIKPFTQVRALVVSDPEYAQGDIDLYNLSSARPRVTTLEQARVELVERVGKWIIERRFSEQIKSGAACYRNANTTVLNLLGDATLVNASVSGEPKDWEQMLAALVTELNRAREFGFLAGEFALCKKELVSEAEDAVRKEATRAARGVLLEMAEKVNESEPILAALQQLEVLQQLLPTIRLEEVTAAFAANYRPEGRAYVVTLPKKDDVKLPTEDEVLAAAQAASARQLEPPHDVKAATDLLPQLPKPGKLAEATKDEDLGITSGWLENGVRIHHRYMEDKQDLVILTIALAGGEIEETADNAGVTRLTGMIVSQPATSRLSSTDLEDIMTGKNIQFGGGGESDACILKLEGSPKDLEIGLQLTYAVLTDGKLEPSAFANWKEESLQQYAMNSKMAPYVAFDAWAQALGGNDPRQMLLLTPERVEAQSLERGQAWFERLAHEAPIEVAVVGEIRFDDVRPLLEQYLGSLPRRTRGAAHLDKLRKLDRAAGPHERRLEIETITPQAMTITGFASVNTTNVPELRALNLAGNVLESRLIKRVREELSLVYSLNVQNHPEPTYDDSGAFLCGAPCAPENVDAVLKEVDVAFKAFAESGPTAEELDNAKKQVVNRLDTQLKEPSYWSHHLSAFDLHKTRLTDLKNIPAAYQALTAEQVRDAFRKYCVPARTIRVGVTPKKAATEPSDKEAKPSAAPGGR